jgi:hypothetical protein
MLVSPSDKEHAVSPKKTPSEKSPSDDTTTEVETAPPPPAAETTEVPVTGDASTGPRYTRGVIAAGAAGLLVAGGLAGFGIGRATGDEDGPQFNRIGQVRPGEQGPGREDGQRDQRNGPPMPGQDGGPGGWTDGNDFPPMPDDDPNTSGT